MMRNNLIVRLVICAFFAVSIFLFNPQTNQAQNIKLTPTNDITVKIHSKVSRTFVIEAKKQQVISLQIKQNGTDVKVELDDPQGETIAFADFPFSEQELERIYVVTDSDGKYLLKIDSKFLDNNGLIVVKLNELTNATDIDRKHSEAEKLFSEAQVLRATGKTSGRKKAVEVFERSLVIWREIGDQIGELRTLAVLSYLNRLLENYERSLELAETILKVPDSLQVNVYKADAFYQIGQIQFEQREGDKAVESFQQSLSLFLKPAPEQANIWTALGNAYQLTDDLELAEEAFAKALENSHAFPDMYNEAQALYQRGFYYFNYNYREEAVTDFTAVAELRKKFGNLRGYAKSLTMLAMTLQVLKQYKDSIEPLEKALPISVQLEDYENQVDTLIYLGLAYREENNFPKALEIYRQAVQIADRNNIKETSLYLSLGVTYLRGADFVNARENFETSLEFFRQRKDTSGEALTLYHYAFLEREENNLDAALEKIETAVKEIDSEQTSFKNPQRLAAFLANRRRYFDLYIDVLMRLAEQRPHSGFSLKALQINETSRMRTLLWYYREAVKNTPQAADFELLNQLQKKQQILGEKLAMLANAQSKQNENVAEIEAKITELNQQIESFKARLRRSNPNVADFAQLPVLSLEQMQSELDDETILVEYSLGEKRSYLWIVGKNSFQSFILPKRSEIDTQSAALYETLSNNTNAETVRRTDKTTQKPTPKLKTFTEAAAALSKLLATEKLGELNAKRIVFVSDGGLNMIPLASLFMSVSEQKFIGDKFEITQIPSLTTLSVLRGQNIKPFSPNSLAVIADPVFTATDERLAKFRKKKTETKNTDLTATLRDFDLKAIPRLPFSRIEAEKIAANFGDKTNLNLDFKASRERILNGEFDNYDILHFATHGFLNSKHPELSGLVLSLYNERGDFQNGFLRTQDLYLLKLKPQLVVLSACQTGLGKQLENEGLIGLTRGFLANGTPRVIATLWKVDDAATAEFMSRFYRAMLKENQKPPAALKTAQNELKAIPRYSNPKYWAGFTLTGEWK